MKYSDLTPQDLAGLRILASLEPAYPDHDWTASKGLRPSVVLAGHAAWKAKRQALARRQA